jgi:HTH-type transcriptional regulator/antitoxin HigA
VIDLLHEAGLVPAPPRGPLAAARHEELGALANVLLAGCNLDARAFTPQEASDAVLATCSLGLECWPARWRDGGTLSDDVLVEHDLVTVFQVGWTVLHDDVCVAAVSRLLGVMASLPAHDPETQAGLDALRLELTRHWRAGTAWQSRDALDVLVTLIEAYEDKHYPMDPPDPIEAIKYRMEQQGLTRKDLEPMIGTRTRVAEVLNGKRNLSISMIRNLHAKLGISAEVLIQPPRKPQRARRTR